jgi:ribosomal protein S12 methylthiotransferase
VPARTKKQRVAEVMELQSAISQELNSQKVGTRQRVLIDRKVGDHYIGRTQHDSPEVDNEVHIDAASGYLRAGDFADVEITGADMYDLTAIVLT